MSVLSLAIAIMPKTEPVIAQNSTDAEYVQAISALSRAIKYTVSSDSVGGNMTIGGGKADDPAPIGTKMYFSYTVESATAEYRSGYYEEGLSVFKISETIPFGTYSYDKGLTRCELQCSPYLLQNGHTYYCIIEKISDTSFEYNIYKNENGNIRLAFKNSDNELYYTYSNTSEYYLADNGGMGLYFYANISNLTLKDIENDGFATTVNEDGVDYYVYYGSLVNLQNHNYSRAFSGIGYATLTVAGVETTIYGGYTKANQSRSIYQVVKAVLADDTLDPNGLQKTKAKEFVDSVVMATIKGTTVVMDADGSVVYDVTVVGTTVTITAKAGGNLSNIKSIVLNGSVYTEFVVENDAIASAFTLCLSRITNRTG